MYVTLPNSLQIITPLKSTATFFHSLVHHLIKCVHLGLNRHLDSVILKTWFIWISTFLFSFMSVVVFKCLLVVLFCFVYNFHRDCSLQEWTLTTSKLYASLKSLTCVNRFHRRENGWKLGKIRPIISSESSYHLVLSNPKMRKVTLRVNI